MTIDTLQEKAAYVRTQLQHHSQEQERHMAAALKAQGALMQLEALIQEEETQTQQSSDD